MHSGSPRPRSNRASEASPTPGPGSLRSRFATSAPGPAAGRRRSRPGSAWVGWSRVHRIRQPGPQGEAALGPGPQAVARPPAHVALASTPSWPKPEPARRALPRPAEQDRTNSDVLRGGPRCVSGGHSWQAPVDRARHQNASLKPSNGDSALPGPSTAPLLPLHGHTTSGRMGLDAAAWNACAVVHLGALRTVRDLAQWLWGDARAGPQGLVGGFGGGLADHAHPRLQRLRDWDAAVGMDCRRRDDGVCLLRGERFFGPLRQEPVRPPGSDK